MESIFHEKQEGALCAQHCLNSLLQGPFFTAVDLASIAQDLDEAERQRMAEGNTTSADYLNFMREPSSNMDDSGYFSVQVICKALNIWNLDMMPYNSSAAEYVRKNPTDQKGYICNQQNHWLTIRKLGSQWFNLNSIKAYPELISDTYLSLLLAQLQTEGYSIFIITGEIPQCESQQILELCPVTSQAYKIYIEKQRVKTQPKEDAAKKEVIEIEPPKVVYETADENKVRNKRLQYFESKQTASNDSVPKAENLSEDEMLKIAMEMSMQPI